MISGRVPRTVMIFMPVCPPCASRLRQAASSCLHVLELQQQGGHAMRRRAAAVLCEW